jgi:beta-galactosidase
MRPEAPAIEINGETIPPIAYTSYLPRSKYYAEVAQCGLHLYSFPAYIAHRGINMLSGIGPFRRGIWTGEDELDFTDIHEDMGKILAADPDARVIMRICLDVPEWWEEKHPEGCCQLRDGTTRRQSFSSSVWLASVGDVLRKIVEWIAASEYAPRFVGIHVAAGRTEEWFPHLYNEPFFDANPERLVKFNAFLNRRYPTAAARAEAWRDSKIKDSAEALAMLEQSAERRWRDLRQDAAALDACRFHSELMVDSIAVLCRIVKAASGGRLLTGAFYGYHVYVTDARMAHTALSKLLECPDLDYLASPNAYHSRKPGRDWPPMAAVDSVRLHGKIWMAENDTRTFLTRPLREVAPGICPEGQYEGGLWAGPDSLETSATLMRNNLARMLTHGYGGWWFDMWGGWYSHPVLLAEIRAAQQLWFERLEPSDPKRIPSDSVCVVMDERVSDLDASFGSLCGPLVANHFALGHCGRPYTLYLRDDLQRLDLSEAPFIWLLGLPSLTDAERALVEKVVASGGAVMHTDTKTTRLMSRRDAVTEARMEFDHLNLTEEELRAALDTAGVHRYVSTGDVFYMGRGYAAIHAVTEGVKHIDIPGAPTLRQVLPPAADGSRSSTECFMNQYETRIFRIE